MGTNREMGPSPTFRSLMKSAATPLPMVASDSGVVAVGVPIVNVDSSVYDGHNGGYIPRRDGAVLVDVPTCGQGVTESTVVFAGGFPRVVAPGVTSPVETTPANEGTTTNVGPPDTAPAETATANSCPVDSGPQQSDLIPWSDLGVDPTAVAAMFSPRVFVSTDGENFVEGAFPALPDGYQMNQIDVVATSNGYAASATLYAPMAGKGLAKLYTSPDGMTWTESDMPAGQYSYINVLNDGMVIAFGLDLTDSRPFAAVSADGALWTKVSLANLLEASDGATAQLNVWMSAAGPGGITAVAGIDVDPAAEAGGLSIEKDGVRLTMTESRYQAMVATDIATGDELGRFGGKSPTDSSGYLSYDQEGNYRVLNPDGTVRVVFDNTDMQGLFAQQDSVAPPKAVVLHSADGFNWSRDDIKPITGLSIYGTNRVQVTDSNVLVSMVDPNSRDAAGLPKTVVLVGTAKS